jgi:hypothetical protein
MILVCSFFDVNYVYLLHVSQVSVYAIFLDVLSTLHILRQCICGLSICISFTLH